MLESGSQNQYRRAAEYAREHEEATSDFSEYLNNPINAYLLVKRLTSDWRDVEKLMVNDIGEGTELTHVMN
jgi:hypothetical protein